MGMKIGIVEYNGQRSDTLGIFVSGKGAYDAAEFDYTAQSVPGRNGDILLSNGKYKNITVTYPAFVPNDFENRAQAVRNWMRSANTYARLQDNYDKDHFRLGLGKSLLTFTPGFLNRGANFQIQFDCKPQRFLVHGENELTVTSGMNVLNDTLFTARPLIIITNPTASATITFTHSDGVDVMTATGAYTGTMTIDCETMNIYSGSTNLNSKFSGDFPVLRPGVTAVTFSGITAFKIVPRWWEL